MVLLEIYYEMWFVELGPIEIIIIVYVFMFVCKYVCLSERVGGIKMQLHSLIMPWILYQ